MNNPYIIVPIVAWVVAQVTKFGLKAVKGDVSGHYLYESGSMPSSHAAIVSSLAVVALIKGGFESASFGISVVVMIIVMIDALNVRRAVGENRKAILTLYKLVPFASRRTKDDDVLEHNKALGHTPSEVAVGAGIGAAIAYALLYADAASQSWGLNSKPVGLEAKVYLGFFIFWLIVGLILSAINFRGKARKLKASLTLRRSFRNIFVYPSMVGLLFYGGLESGIDFLSRRLWIWITFVVIFGSLVYYSRNLFERYRELALKESEERIHQKQIEKRRKNKKSKKRR